MPEIQRAQWNGIIDLVPVVIQCGSQNPHDEVQMVSQKEWLGGCLIWACSAKPESMIGCDFKPLLNVAQSM